MVLDDDGVVDDDDVDDGHGNVADNDMMGTVMTIRCVLALRLIQSAQSSNTAGQGFLGPLAHSEALC